MDVVVDASVLIAIVAEEPQKSALVAATREARLLAPQSVHWEVGNAFSAMLKRKRVTLAQCETALAAYQKIVIMYLDVDLKESLRWADRLGLYAYDAYVLSCAAKQGVLLLTLDRGLIAAARRAGVRILEIV